MAQSEEKPKKKNKQKHKNISYLRSVWSRYESIPNSYNKNAIGKIKKKFEHLTRDDIVWCATEKVHGANFSMITNGKIVLAASRNFILDASSKFFEGWQDVVIKNKEKVLKAFKIMNQESDNNINAIIIYGELFGGLYNHHDDKFMAASDQKAIQKGIFYSPTLNFYAFDIKTVSEDGQQHLSVEESNGIFEECDLLHAKILKQGTFDEMMRINVDNLQSTIPKYLDLPPPIDLDTKEEIENIAEGAVIRPLRAKEHVLLKIKSQNFLEITHSFSKWTNKRKNELKMDEYYQRSNEVIKEELFGLIARCVNKQRLQSVESKIGRLNDENKKQIQDMFLDDVFDELQQDETQKKFIDGLNRKQIQEMEKFITALVDRLLNKEMHVGIGRNMKKRKRKRQRSRRGSKNKMKMENINQEMAKIALDNEEIIKNVELSGAKKRKLKDTKKGDCSSSNISLESKDGNGAFISGAISQNLIDFN